MSRGYNFSVVAVAEGAMETAEAASLAAAQNLV